MRIVLLHILFFFFVSDCIGQNLIRGPYLTSATQNSIIITWRTDVACNSKVSYGTSPGVFGGGSINNNLVTEHVIKLNGLATNTKYYYAIGTSNITLQGNAENYFRTLPITSPTYDKPIRIWAVGDVAKATLNEEHVRDDFLNYVDTNYVDGYLMLGDNAYPSGEDVNFQTGFFNYFQSTVTKHTVLWPALGNHEYDNNSTRRQSHAIAYYDIFTLPTQGECGGLPSNTEMYYSFNIGNAHFINLDSYGLEEVGGNYYGISDTTMSPQINWLKQDLHSNTLPWVIVSFHHPPYCMGTHNSDTEADLTAIRENLIPIFERFNVDLVLNGHSHTYERSNFIHHHYGLEASYDSTLNLVQHTSGTNDTSSLSCPYIKNSSPALPSDSGLLYLVIGSGSDNHIPPQATWPHNAMYYSNNDDYGSLLLTITGNKLEAVWISTDTSQRIKDRFTIYKNVNRKHYLFAAPGSNLALQASWTSENDYVWSTGDSTKEISITANPFQLITVSDKKACLTDSFFISLAAPNDINETHKTNFHITPNPIHDAIYLEHLEPGFYTISLIDSQGKAVLTHNIEVQFYEEKKAISVSKFPDGNYIVTLEKEGRKAGSQKIIIAH